MPPPTVMLMMPAARPSVPMARTSDSGGAIAVHGSFRSNALNVKSEHCTRQASTCYRSCRDLVGHLADRIGGHPGFPGDTTFSQQWTARIGPGCPVNLSAITMSPHLGAHADAPLHYGVDAPDIAAVSLDPFLGRCRVIHAMDPGPLILPEHLADASSGLPPRVLVRTCVKAPTHLVVDLHRLCPGDDRVAGGARRAPGRHRRAVGGPGRQQDARQPPAAARPRHARAREPGARRGAGR